MLLQSSGHSHVSDRVGSPATSDTSTHGIAEVQQWRVQQLQAGEHLICELRVVDVGQLCEVGVIGIGSVRLLLRLHVERGQTCRGFTHSGRQKSHIAVTTALSVKML